MNNEDGSETPLRGTAYVFDEIHNVYPSRQWHNTPRRFNFYGSQHGKLNDHNIYTTQALKDADSVVYRNAQSFTYCRNHRLEKFGRFKRGSGFEAKTYNDPRSSDAVTPVETLQYKFDPKVAALYDTSAGIGMPGGGTADGGHSVKGIPLKSVWVLCALAICAVYVLFNYVIPKYTHKFLGGVIAGSVTGKLPVKTAQAPAAAKPIEKFAIADARPFAVPEPGTTRPKPEADPVRVRGYVLSGGKVNLILSDGRTLIEGDESLERLQRNGATVDGKKLYMVTPAPSSPGLVQDRRSASSKSGSVESGVPSEDEARSREAKTSQIEVVKPIASPAANNGVSSSLLGPSSMSSFDSTRRITPIKGSR